MSVRIEGLSPRDGFNVPDHQPFSALVKVETTASINGAEVEIPAWGSIDNARGSRTFRVYGPDAVQSIQQRPTPWEGPPTTTTTSEPLAVVVVALSGKAVKQ